MQGCWRLSSVAEGHCGQVSGRSGRQRERQTILSKIERYLLHDDNSIDKMWSLVDWIRDRGSEDFSITFESLRGTPPTHCDDAERKLKPFEIESRSREHLEAPEVGEFIRETRLGALTPSSLSVLKELLPDGPFTLRIEDEGWLEDPIFYRGGELVLGVDSHESLGVVRLLPREHKEVEELGIWTKSELPPPWSAA